MQTNLQHQKAGQRLLGSERMRKGWREGFTTGHKETMVDDRYVSIMVINWFTFNIWGQLYLNKAVFKKACVCVCDTCISSSHLTYPADHPLSQCYLSAE